MNSSLAHRAQSRLSVPGVQYESEDEPNGEIAQRRNGATAGMHQNELLLEMFDLLMLPFAHPLSHICVSVMRGWLPCYSVSTNMKGGFVWPSDCVVGIVIMTAVL